MRPNAWSALLGLRFSRCPSRHDRHGRRNHPLRVGTQPSRGEPAAAAIARGKPTPPPNAMHICTRERRPKRRAVTTCALARSLRAASLLLPPPHAASLRCRQNAMHIGTYERRPERRAIKSRIVECSPPHSQPRLPYGRATERPNAAPPNATRHQELHIESQPIKQQASAAVRLCVQTSVPALPRPARDLMPQ